MLWRGFKTSQSFDQIKTLTYVLKDNFLSLFNTISEMYYLLHHKYLFNFEIHTPMKWEAMRDKIMNTYGCVSLILNYFFLSYTYI